MANIGSLFGIIGNFQTGDLVFDSENTPIKKHDNSKLLLTTDLIEFDNFKLSIDEMYGLFLGKCAESIDKYNAVTIDSDGRLILAGKSGRAIGISLHSAVSDEKLYIKTSDFFIINEPFNFTAGPIFLGKNGELKQKISYSDFVQTLGTAYSENLIKIKIGEYNKIL